ncbi:MAG: hypothetical protein APF84_18240 [Gracilibacter sp. BRH_c7a]|nr:MAG: hypothetical protein APF84_18240 [Gracilibacter sp. BRH_c7a]
MFHSKKPETNWILLSTAMLGGFALGLSYKKYGSNLHTQIGKLTKRDLEYEDYTSSHEPDA